ncbi:carbohydrate ABC transporter permease [Halalkalibacter kiskunsagensis]|uniref:Carbohydrate ABC transporter permease n=1 Tax=Halalkalibacter kiskunsagensis TaxID=1548599 RepID=A0ABV6KBJ6_9BACI
MMPAFLIYSLFFIYPFFRTFYYSFFDWSGIGEATFIGFQNYLLLLNDQLFLSGLGRVTVWALLAILIKVGLALILANILRQPIVGSKIFTSAFFIPVIISTAAISVMFTLIYDLDVGVLNIFLSSIGLESWTKSWLGNEQTAFYAVIAAPIYHTIGYFFIILLAAMQNISGEIYEAAKIDGANAWVTFTKVTIPQIWPILQICIILAITGAMKSFDYVFVMTKGGPANSTQVPATYMFETIFEGMRYGYGTAIAFAIFMFSFFVTIVFRKLTSSK